MYTLYLVSSFSCIKGTVYYPLTANETIANYLNSLLFIQVSYQEFVYLTTFLGGMIPIILCCSVCLFFFRVDTSIVLRLVPPSLSSAKPCLSAVSISVYFG